MDVVNSSTAASNCSGGRGSGETDEVDAGREESFPLSSDLSAACKDGFKSERKVSSTSISEEEGHNVQLSKL